MFEKIKQLYELKKQADEMKKELEKEVIQVQSGEFKTKINGNMKFLEIQMPVNPEADKLKDFLNKAIEQSQKSVAKKMQGMMGGLGDIQNLLKG